ncbi:MAG: hypothetical protein K2J62_09325, partial [Bacteroidales bacterium]|nr:hypothetical protein [Bacteroidales bacterium]
GIRQATLDKNVPNSEDDIATKLKKNRFRGQNSFGSTCFHLTLLLRVNLNISGAISVTTVLALYSLPISG